MEEIPNPINLNKLWRVWSDGVQWWLERRVGDAAWKAERHFRDRQKLFEIIAELCGDIHSHSREALDLLPARHP